MTTIHGPTGIRYFQMLALKGALSLELKGFRRGGRSAYSIVKRTYGFRGSRQKVFEQFSAYVEEFAEANKETLSQEITV